MKISNCFSQVSYFILQTMSNKLMLAVHEKYKRSSSKSRLKNHNNSNEAINILPQKEKQIVFTSQKVTKLLEDFDKQIFNPIQLYNQLYQSKAPQKCLQHDNISTLYCLKDQRLLCAGCMYQTPIHKGHKVIPLNKANDIMAKDIKNTSGLIEEHLKICKKVIEKTVKNLQKAQKEYPQLMQQVHNFFMELHQLLIDRKNEHLQLLNQTWSKLRYENYTMKAQLTRIYDYVRIKIDDVAGRQSADEISYNKNIVDHLSKIRDIIDQDMVEIEENNYFKEISKFKTVSEYVNNNLVLEQIKNKTIQSLYLADYKLKKSNSKTSIKKNATNLPSKSPRKDNLKGKLFTDAQKTAEDKLLEMHFGDVEEVEISTRKSPKNRHSINQVRLMNELNDRKRAFQKDKLKKKIALTPTKSQKSIKKQMVSSPKSTKKQKSNIKQKA